MMRNAKAGVRLDSERVTAYGVIAAVAVFLVAISYLVLLPVD